MRRLGRVISQVLDSLRVCFTLLFNQVNELTVSSVASGLVERANLIPSFKPYENQWLTVVAGDETNRLDD